MPSGRALPRTDWSRVSGRLILIVRPMLAARVRTQAGPVWTTVLHLRLEAKKLLSRRSTLKHQKNLGKFTEIKFFPSQFQNMHV